MPYPSTPTHSWTSTRFAARSGVRSLHVPERKAALRVRGLAVPEATRKVILAQKDPERLERWLERAIVAASIDEVIDEPS